MNEPSIQSPHRGVALRLRRRRFDGPIVREIRAGLASIVAEVRRMVARVSLQCELSGIERQEKRAVREVHWLRHELTQQERNLDWLQIEYRARREVLTARLEQLVKVPQ
ncbi:hypothetical protein [Cupriavidus taiwanensis]|uniref:hypothetical protein n=1 Tax=Cupriavidus taiwanensis TaxID=164546 RepID=UPI00046EFC6D|nr:hypothetical protein [Cupriavidus taiwanensis]SOZ12055.1 conserved protein of unknown function [Cupriavidus taiwanensis]